MLQVPFLGKDQIQTQADLFQYLTKLTSDPHKYRCPISLSIMKDPVFMSDGHTVDRESAASWFRTQKASFMGYDDDEDVQVIEDENEGGAEGEEAYDFTDEEEEEDAEENRFMRGAVRSFHREEDDEDVIYTSPLTNEPLSSSNLIPNHAKRSELDDFRRRNMKKCYEAIDYILNHMSVNQELANEKGEKKTMEQFLKELFERLNELDTSSQPRYHELLIRFKLVQVESKEYQSEIERFEQQIEIWTAMKSMGELHREQGEDEVMITTFESTLDCMLGFNKKKLREELRPSKDKAGTKRSRPNDDISDREIDAITSFYSLFSSMLNQVTTSYTDDMSKEIESILVERLAFVSNLSSTYDELKPMCVDLLLSHWSTVKTSKRLMKKLIASEQDRRLKKKRLSTSIEDQMELYDLNFHLSKLYKIGSRHSMDLVRKAINGAKENISNRNTIPKLMIMYDRLLLLVRQRHFAQDVEIQECMDCVNYLREIGTGETLSFCEKVLRYLHDKYDVSESVISVLVDVLIKRDRLGEALTIMKRRKSTNTDSNAFAESLTEIVAQYLKSTQQKIEDLERSNRALKEEVRRLSYANHSYTWDVSTEMYDHLKQIGTSIKSQAFTISGREFALEIGTNRDHPDHLGCYLNCLDAHDNPCHAEFRLSLLYNGQPGFVSRDKVSQWVNFTFEDSAGFGTEMFSPLFDLSLSNYTHKPDNVWKFKVEVKVKGI